MRHCLEHIQTFVRATSASTHLIMDFISLSPLDDDLFRRDHDHHSSEADNFTITSVPETPIPVAQKPSRKQASSKSNSVSSMVRIPPGSSLLNLQDYHSSPDDSFVSQPTSFHSKESTRNFQNRKSLSPQFAVSFTLKKRSLPPSF